jgi:hypothetical protein
MRDELVGRVYGGDGKAEPYPFRDCFVAASRRERFGRDHANHVLIGDPVER